MKKFFALFGGFGVILYYIVTLVIAVLPFVMIDVSFWLTFLFIGINLIFPPATIVFWIWGLVCAINGVQDVFAIIYYVVFVAACLPFFIGTVSAFFKKD